MFIKLILNKPNSETKSKEFCCVIKFIYIWNENNTDFMTKQKNAMNEMCNLEYLQNKN